MRALTRNLLYTLAIACVAIAFVTTATIASAQTELPEGTTQAQIDAALADISELYGSSVVRADQARAICDQEQYFLACAEIGKEHGLFHDERAEQVDTIIEELKGDMAEKIAACTSTDCLIEVAGTFARQFNKEHPTIARAVDLTPQKVDEKQTIIDAAKEIGIDFEQCRTMDPDTAQVELLRVCARLAKDVRVQQHIPTAVREQTGKSDASIELKTELASGQLQCGDGTLDGCGNFCLNPSAEARAQGTAAIPAICRQIAERFFGQDGVRELESAYTQVQQTRATTLRNQEVVFTTPDGQTLASPEAIGRYMEEAGSRGDVEAVKAGFDFLVARGFVRTADRDFALKMVERIRDRGAINFDECSTNPDSCRDFVPADHQGEFVAMGQVEKIMRTEMASRGVTDPSRCEFDPNVGKSCMEAARATLPQLRALNIPQLAPMIADLEQKIRFGEEGIAARGRAEERIREEGKFDIGDRMFGSMSEVESFCREQPQTCLAEAARAGFIERNVASERYQYTAQGQYEHYNSDQRYQSMPYPEVGIAPNEQQQYRTFDKEAARKAFEAWLDDPQGPPPMPPGTYPPYPPPYYPPYQPGTTSAPYPYPYPGPICPSWTAYYSPCPQGEYRQESRDANGCIQMSACIPIETKTQPKPIDGKTICPAMPTVNSCPDGEEKAVSFSSPECGTYYTCYPKRDTKTQVKFPHTFGSGRVVSSYEAARSHCYESGSYGATARGDLGECGGVFGFSVPPIPPEKQCAEYGAGWYPVDSSGNCFGPDKQQYRTPKGTLEQCSTTPVYGCNIGTSCPSGQYWNGTSCVSNTTDGMKKCFYPNATINDKQPGYTVWCERDYYNCHVGEPSGAPVSLNGLKLGAPSRCESGGYDPTPTIGSECRALQSSSACSAKSGCKWFYGYNGAEYCDSGTTGTSCGADTYWDSTTQSCKSSTVTGSCSSDMMNLLGGGCHNMGSAWFSGDKMKYVMPGTTEVKYCSTSWVTGCGSGGGGSDWTNKTWKFADNTSQYSSVLSRTDSEYSTFIDGVYNDCAGKYFTGWKPGGGDQSNWREFGIPECSTTKPTGSTSCSSGMYWNGTSCTNTTSGPMCSTYTTMSSCVANAACNWNSSSNYCTYNSNTGSSCPSGQYWDGTKCGTAQEGCTRAGGTWDSATNYCKMPGTTTTTTAPNTSTPEGCAQAGRVWDGANAFCKPIPPPPTGVSPTSAQYQCSIAGGTWNEANKYCNMPASSTAQQNCTAGGGTWDQSANYCKMPNNNAACGSGMYWNGSACVSSSTGTSGSTNTASGMQKCFYPNATINGKQPGYTVWCEKDYYNCHVGEPSGATVSLSGLALGAPSTCETGWSSGSGTCSTYTTMSSCAATSGCRWDPANYCTSNYSSGSGSASCGSYTSMSSCVGNSACNWNSSGNYCMYNTSSSSCGSGMYWDSATQSCKSSSTTSTTCPSGEWWDSSTNSCRNSQAACAEAGGTWNSSSNYCTMSGSSGGSSSCGSGMYWNGSACVSNTTSTGGSTSGTIDYSSMQSGCASAGGTWDSTSNYCQMPSSGGSSSCGSGMYWNGSACVANTSYFCPQGHEWNGSHCTFAQGQEKFTASVINAFLSLFGLAL